MRVWLGCRRRLLARAASSTRTFPDVPGLVVFPDFVTTAEHDTALRAAREVSDQAHAIAVRGHKSKVSQKHNLNSREEFVNVSLPVGPAESFTADAAGVTTQAAELQGEHFVTYGDGHRLTYLRGNVNLPVLGLGASFLTRLRGLSCVDDELKQRRTAAHKADAWRMALNYYPPAGDEGRPGFPWHRDLQLHGAATMILALGHQGALEFAEPTADKDGLQYADHSVLRRVTVPSRALAVLTGPSRWHLLHRVAPETNAGERITVVYGVW
eukprot:TRINITY_DN43164_c0_g1_i1.p1 TRINITY_DN43164_c0_g1~~TRINITY_DN43164_c0_g1_i1.p1  ORF type:complete len:269 (+),score=50.28 TRINITY_DN43164_c0_g1_i1:55-861(+)